MKSFFAGLILCLICVYSMPIPVQAADTRFEDMKDKTSGVYDAMKERVEKISEDELIANGKYGERAFLWVYDLYVSIKAVSVYIGAFSILLGIFLCFLVRHNKKLYRNIFLAMVIGVPVLLVMFCFGVGILIG